MQSSLGLIETLGYVAATEAADAGSKAANVTLRGYERGRAGLITVKFAGEVAAVRAAVTAGATAARRVGMVLAVHVIAHPVRALEVISEGWKSQEEKKQSGEEAKEAGPAPPEPAGVSEEVTEEVIGEATGAEEPLKEVKEVTPELTQVKEEVAEGSAKPENKPAEAAGPARIQRKEKSKGKSKRK
ncbi:MAG: hypothetical protein CXZ00_14070 [Acidobacteria bacterium]|nr:MAG: hypothetical protein CXZ00_14070 [Acidobacteriota bacterium]